MRPEFCEAFVKQCYDRGMSEDNTLDLFRHAHLQELLEEDPDFRSGWDHEFDKYANPVTAIVPAAVKAVAKAGMPLWKKTLLGAGGLAAAGVGAGVATKALNPDGASFIPALQDPQRNLTAPAGAVVGGVAGLGLAGAGAAGLYPGGAISGIVKAMKRNPGGAGSKVMGGLGTVARNISRAPGPWWAKALAGAGATAIGAGAGYGAGYFSGAPDISNGPGAAGPYLPDALQPAGASTSGPSHQSLLDIPSMAAVGAGGAGAAGSLAPGSSVGAQNIQASNKQLTQLNSDIQKAQEQQTAALATTGIQGSSQAMEIRRRIADLESQKRELLHGANSYLGLMREQQGQSLGSIDQAEAETLAARSARQPRADAMDRVLRGQTGGWTDRLFNWATGAEGQASQMASQQRNLDAYLKRLQADRDRVNKMLIPGT